MTETATRILLADDHTLFRQGLERVLREAFPKAEFGHAVRHGLVLCLSLRCGGYEADRYTNNR